MTEKNNLPAEQLDELFALSQPQLRAIASFLKRRDRNATLNVTALVNELYVKLREGAPVIHSELHLRRLAGRAMRQILADAARRRIAQKRGGADDVQFITWDENIEAFVKSDRELLALDAALTELSGLERRQAEAVEGHFFGGLTWDEVAECQGVSTATVQRDWRMVRAWLAEAVAKNR